MSVPERRATIAGAVSGLGATMSGSAVGRVPRLRQAR